MSEPLQELKKLVKTPSPVVSNGLAQLRKLNQNPTVNKVARETSLAMVNEALTPFKPLFSYFNDSAGQISYTSVPATPKVASIPTNVNKMSLARLPFKSPACKKCPAKMGGLCQCALKKL